jgi:hypothetical protein
VSSLIVHKGFTGTFTSTIKFLILLLTSTRGLIKMCSRTVSLGYVFPVHAVPQILRPVPGIEGQRKQVQEMALLRAALELQKMLAV